jgi:hypothetical protein
MYYALIPCMPINRTILELLGLPSAPKGRLMYRGDVFFLKVKRPSDSGKFNHTIYSRLPFKHSYHKLLDCRYM